MRRFVTMCLMLVALSACDLEFAGLNAVDDYATELLASAVPDRVECGTTPAIDVGETVRCRAYNAAGTLLGADGITGAIWETFPSEIGEIDQNGNLTGLMEGVVTVDARGPGGTRATLEVSVGGAEA